MHQIKIKSQYSALLLQNRIIKTLRTLTDFRFIHLYPGMVLYEWLVVPGHDNRSLYPRLILILGKCPYNIAQAASFGNRKTFGTNVIYLHEMDILALNSL